MWFETWCRKSNVKKMSKTCRGLQKNVKLMSGRLRPQKKMSKKCPNGASGQPTEVNEEDAVHQVDKVDEVHQVHQVDPAHQVNKVDEVHQVHPLDPVHQNTRQISNKNGWSDGRPL